MSSGSIPFDRRTFLKSAMIAGAGAFALSDETWAAEAGLQVLCPLPPDPAPPGAAKFGEAQLNAWQKDHAAKVAYEAIAWPQLHDRLATNFASGTHTWDVVYMGGWAPEFAKFLLPYVDQLPADLVKDMPASSFETVKWDSKRYGSIFTLSLLTLFYNTEHFDKQGIKEPPKTWDDLKRISKQLTGGGQYGFVLNYGDPAGIGGVASYWMTYLQQAGGKMYDDKGMPVFNDAPGIDALQFMIDLFKAGTDPGSPSYVGINDATNVMLAGKASMMMNWPFTYKSAQDPTTSKIVGKLGSAILPAGPAGTASIDGSDAWSIAADTKNPELARQLIEFYLSPEVQKQQALDTGWLPIRTSVLADPDVQKALPIAAVVLEQSKHPYNSFVTPDYTQVTQIIGTEVQKALQGGESPKDALKNASDQVTALVKQRG